MGEKASQASAQEHISEMTITGADLESEGPDFNRDSAEKMNRNSVDGVLPDKEFQNSFTEFGESFTLNKDSAVCEALEISEKGSSEISAEDCRNTNYSIIGVAADAYVFVELEDRVLVIDKHAAHERILFEKMKANMYDGVSCSQVLLIPEKISLSDEEYAAAVEYRDEILRTGFSFELHDNECCALITQVPAELDNASASDMFSEIFNEAFGWRRSRDFS